MDFKSRGPLLSDYKMRRLDLTTWGLTCVGRLLLIFSGLSLLTMPITEHLWTWDRFLQTGRDFELGLLLVLTLLCLVLVLSKQHKHTVESMLAMCRRLAIRHARVAMQMCPAGAFTPDAELLSRSRMALCGFSLQI